MMLERVVHVLPVVQVFQNLDVLPKGTDHFSIPESRGAVMRVFFALDLSWLFLTVPGPLF